MKIWARLSILYIALAAGLATGPAGWAAQPDPARFLHTPLDSHLITQNLTIAAQMADAANVTAVTLFFKSPDKAAYTQRILQDPARTGVWKVDVVSGELSPLGVNYYMEGSYKDGSVYRSKDYSTVILIIPPAIQDILYHDDASKTDVKIVQGELILKLDPALPPDLVPNAINTLVLRQNGKVLAIDNAARLVRMQIPATLDLKTAMNDLSAQSSVAFVEPHGLYELVLTPNDPRLAEQWAVPKIRLPAAWDVTTGDVSVIVGVIDTGRDPNHPDLQGKFLPGYDYYANDPDPTDVGGHGTMVSGVVGAVGGNGVGIAGTNWRCKILPYRTGDGLLSGWAIVESIRAAADNGARVINMSFGSSAGWQAEHDALIYAYNKGVVLVAAAGNSGTSAPQYPAAYPEVISAVATNSSDQKAYFSTYGTWVDVSAPGQDILTTTVGGGYRSVSGTSFASPYTAGVASLILSVNPKLTNVEVRQILRQTAVDLGEPGFDNAFGYGRIDAKAAVDAAVQSSGDETPPIIAHTPVTLTQAGISVTIQATITDNVAVQSATVLYRRLGTPTFGETLMQYLGGHVFEGVIPKDAVAPPAVEYAIKARDAKGNTAQTPTHRIAMIDNTPPVVQHTKPDSAEAGLSLAVSATITDDVAVVSADLYARLKDGVTYERYPMKGGAAGVYQAVLPDTLVRSPAVQYYFAATDSAGNQPAGGNPGSGVSPHEVAVVVIDRMPPVITHTPIANGRLIGMDVKVEAGITDNVAVTGATLYYRTQGKSDYDSMPMQLLAGDSYVATVRGAAVVRPAIEYYIDARDAAGNGPPAGQTPGMASRPNVFIVAIDTIPPVIYHQAIGDSPDQLIEGIPVKVSAVVIDNRGLREAWLHHKTSGVAAQSSRPMTYTVSNRYEATLLDSDVQTPAIEYSLTAMDTDGNETRWGPVRVPVYKKIPVVTPKGDTWAYWVPGIAQVLFRDSASGAFVRLGVPAFDTANFSWSPDFSKLVMAGKIGDSWRVYVVAYKETFPTAYQVTDGDWTDLFPSWSADGKYLLFASNRDGDWDVFMKEWDSDGDGIPDKNGKLVKLSTDGDSVAIGSGEILGVARLTMPRRGEIVRSPVRIAGGAFAVVEADGLSQVPAEAFRVEVGEGDSPEKYTVIRQVDKPVKILFDEDLAVWDSSKSVPGRHTICLVVKGNRREVRDCATVWVPGLQISLRMDTTEIPSSRSSFTASGEVFYNYGPRAVNLPVTVGIRETGDTKIVRTDTFGQYVAAFSTPSAAGLYTLTASVSDTEGRRADTSLKFRVYQPGIALTMTVDPAETYPLLMFRVRGRALYLDSQPLVNREVEFEIVQTFKRYYALTDTLGNCTIVMQAPPEPGAYTLYARITDGVLSAETDTPFKVLVPPIDISENLSPPVTYVGAYVAVSGTTVYRLSGAPLVNAPVTITPGWPDPEVVVRTDTAGRYIALIRAANTPGTYPVRVKVSDSETTAANQKELLVLPTFGIGAPFSLVVTLRAIPDTPHRGQSVLLEGDVNYVYQKYRWPPDTAIVTLSVDGLAGTWSETVGPADAGRFKRKIKAPAIPDTYTVRARATEKFSLRGDTWTLIRVLPLTIRLTTAISDSGLPARWPQGPTISGRATYIEIDTAAQGASVIIRTVSGAGGGLTLTDADGRFSMKTDFSRTVDIEVFVTIVDDGMSTASDTTYLRVDSDRIAARIKLDTDVVVDAHTRYYRVSRPSELVLTADFSHPREFPVYREDEIQLNVISQTTHATTWNSTIKLSPIGSASVTYARETYAIPVSFLPDTYIVEYKIGDRYGIGMETVPFIVYMSTSVGAPPWPGTAELELILDLDTHAVYPGQPVNAFGMLRYKDGTPYLADRPVQIDNITTKDRWIANYLANQRLYSSPFRAPMKSGQYEIASSVTENGTLLTDKEWLTVLDTVTSGTAPIPPPLFPPFTPPLLPPLLPPSPTLPLIPEAADSKILVYAPSPIVAQEGDPIEIDGWAVYTTGNAVTTGTCNLYKSGSPNLISQVPPSLAGKFRFTRFAAPPRTTDYEIVVDDGKLRGKAIVKVLIQIPPALPWQPELPLAPPPLTGDTDKIKIYDELYPVQSPDGKYIAYSRRRIGSGEPMNLFISRSDRFGVTTQFTTEDAGDMFPAWSPDGKRIAFGSKRSGNYDVWIKDVDGDGDGIPDAAGRSRQLTEWEGDDNKPTWSPDGTRIAYHSDRSGDYNIFVQAVDGASPPRQLTSRSSYDGYPHWSSDGKYIVFQSNRWGKISDDKDMTAYPGSGHPLYQLIEFDLPPRPGGLLGVKIGDTIHIIDGFNVGASLRNGSSLSIFDLDQKEWTSRALGEHEIVDFSNRYLKLDGKVYLLGKERYFPPVDNYCYDIQKDSWIAISSPEKVLDWGCKVVANDRIYATGVVINDFKAEDTGELYMYEPKMSQWTEKAPEPTTRLLSAAGVLNGKIYIIGGDVIHSNTYTSNVSAVDCYDPVANRWTQKAPTVHGIRNAEARAYDGRLFVIQSQISLDDIPLEIESYDPVFDRWDVVGRLRDRRLVDDGMASIEGVGIFVLPKFSVFNVVQYNPPSPCLSWSAMSSNEFSLYTPFHGAISPSADTWAILSNFNLWYAPAEGGEAKQLTDHYADDLYPAFSPDSKKIAFVSFRTGRGDIYVMKFNPDSPEPPRLLYPPVARCELDTHLTLTGTPIQSDGSKSTDSDGRIDTYVWDFGDGSCGFGINDSHVYATSGTYTIRLLVTDNDGLMDDDTCEIVVLPRYAVPPPTPPPTLPPQPSPPPPDTGALPSPDTDHLKPTLSWYPSGMQDDDTTVLFQLRNMSNNRRDVARGVLVRPFVLDGEEYVDTVIFDTYDLGTMAAVDTRPVRLQIITNKKWESEKKPGVFVRVELRVVQELNWPQHNIGVSGRYVLVKPDRNGKAEELAAVSSVGGQEPVRWSLEAEVGNPEAADRVLNLDRPLPKGLRLTDVRLTGGTASVEESAGGPQLRISDLPLKAGETFTIRCILESDSPEMPPSIRQKILMELENEGWIRVDREGNTTIARKRGVRGKIVGGDTSARVTLFDVTGGKRKKISEIRANDTGEFDPPEIPDDVKTLVIRIESPNSYPIFKRIEVSDGKIIHVIGSITPDTVDSRRGHSHRVDEPGSRQEVVVGEAEDRSRIDIPGRALDREYYVTMRDPKNIAEIEAAAQASGQRLLAAKEYVLIDAQTGEEIHSGFSKRIKVGLSVLGKKAGESAKLAYFDAASGRFEATSATIDAGKNEITADVEHFSVYVSLASPAPAAAPAFTDFSQLLIYPNPYEASYGTNKIIFENIPSGAILTIYTVAGEKVTEITNDGGGDVNGSTRGSAAPAHIGWDLTSRAGRPVASGMYLFLLKDNSGNTKKGRVGIVR